MNTIFIVLFVLVSLVHLYASGKRNNKLRAVTKVLLLPMLLGWYLMTVDAPIWIVIAALATSWLGDVLLIFGRVGFSVGGMFFLASHVCFATAYCMHIDFARVPVWVIICVPLAYFAVAALVFRGLKGCIQPRRLHIGMFVYLLINGTMNCFALFQLVAMPCFATAIMYIGAVNFFASDSILFYTRFRKNRPFKTHFLVMLTYLIAEFLILAGFTLIF